MSASRVTKPVWLAIVMCLLVASACSPTGEASLSTSRRAQPIGGFIAPGRNGAPWLLTNPLATPATEWIINDELRVSISLPAGTVLDPRLRQLSKTDLNNGMVLLQRWRHPGQSGVSALSIQRDPGDRAPVNMIQGYRTIGTEVGTWQLADYGHGDHVPVVGFARIGGYLIEISGTDKFVELLSTTINVTASN